MTALLCSCDDHRRRCPTITVLHFQPVFNRFLFLSWFIWLVSYPFSVFRQLTIRLHIQFLVVPFAQPHSSLPLQQCLESYTHAMPMQRPSLLDDGMANRGEFYSAGTGVEEACR